MEKTQLLVKNIPNITQDIKDVLKNRFNVAAVRSYGRCRAVLHFLDERSATFALQSLHQSEFFGRILSVEYLGLRKQSTISQESEQPKQSPQVPEILKHLYATSIPHGFEQPPPPYLKYNYPPINRTILDSISIALLTNAKFYYQVLHLMNRMNLEPPFLPLTRPFVPPGEPCDAQTQTDKPESEKLLASDESELESDEEHTKARVRKKRQPEIDNAVIKSKVRKIISSQLHEKHPPTASRKEERLEEVFEGDVRNLNRKISLNVSAVTLPKEDTSVQHENVENATVQTEGSPDVIPLIGVELSLNKIPESQWKDLPVFKNYRRGEKSNKLYIKNLSKDTSEDDLRQIYRRYVASDGDISIKLMLFGKMKGQAFVTFTSVGDEFDIVEKALDETNGYILKNKPMIVCFGKRS